MLESEVYDLRVCLKSADKELKEVKDEKGEMKRSHDSKVMSYAQKVSADSDRVCSRTSLTVDTFGTSDECPE